MKNNDKEYFIYIHSTKQKVSVTKEQFDDYYRDINTYRKKMQRQGRCTCPPSKRLLCTMDCITCPYQVESFIRLDETLLDDLGNELSKLDYLQGKNTSLQSPFIDELLSDSDEMNQLLHRLSKLMPEAIEIGKLRNKGLTDKAIAKAINVSRTTFRSRIEKNKKILKKEFPEFF